MEVTHSRPNALDKSRPRHAHSSRGLIHECVWTHSCTWVHTCSVAVANVEKTDALQIASAVGVSFNHLQFVPIFLPKDRVTFLILFVGSHNTSSLWYNCLKKILFLCCTKQRQRIHTFIQHGYLLCNDACESVQRHTRLSSRDIPKPFDSIVTIRLRDDSLRGTLSEAGQVLSCSLSHWVCLGLSRRECTASIRRLNVVYLFIWILVQILYLDILYVFLNVALPLQHIR